MSAFNTSTRREDISVRLKAQNLKNARDQTKQLEEESRKMEDRLRELKMAMGREKENRERQGGFWKTGQTGTLHSYAQDVLDSKPPKQQRSKSGSAKIKVHVLKDEPINVPQRNRGPGTMGYIASKRVNPKDARSKGNQCGQCEERGAAVTCIQCSEDYCAGCFAAFHLKGALKKHRSVPIQANTPRHCYSPRVTSPSPRCPEPSHLPAGSVVPTAPNNPRTTAPHSRNGPEGASGAFEGLSLLQGEYDESGSAASFQEALKAWRSGEETIPTPRAKEAPSGGQTIRQAQNGRQTVGSVEHSTSTSNARVDNPVDVTFHEHGISYAERLLLKRHRRTEVDEYPTDSSRVDCGPSGHSDYDDGHRPSFYDQEGTLVTDRGHVDFRSLYYAVKASECERARSGEESALSITKLPGVPFVSAPAGGERCRVEEVESAPGEAFWSSSSEAELRGLISPKPVQSRIAFVDHSDSSVDGIPPFDRRVPLQTHYSDTSLASPYSGSYAAKASKSCTTPYVTEPDPEVSYTCKKPDEFCEPREETLTCDVVNGASTNEREIKKRPGTGKSRPPSRTRPKSSARAKSRAESRATSLKLGSRSSMYGEGLLTKAPSEQLRAIAQLSSPVDVPAIASLSGFFLAGLDSEGRERTVTEDPTVTRLKQHRVSHRLYQMGPRSWRPNSSLGESVPLDRLDPHGSEGLTLSYTYSGQIEGSPVEVHTGTALIAEPNGADTTLVVRPPSAPRTKKTPSPQSVRFRKHKRDNRCVSSHSDHRMDSPADCGRLSRAIVLDGDDLSRYDTDNQALLSEQAVDDGDTLNQLEWELASETGRITAEGKLSRLELLSSEDTEEEEMTEEILSGRLSQLRTPGPGYDIDTHLNESELMDNFEEMERQLGDEEAVKRLQ